MSRVAKKPIIIPLGIEVKLNNQIIKIKGKNGKLSRIIHNAVKLNYINNELNFSINKGFDDAWILAGTERSLINGMIIGVTKGFSKKLQLVGVGYRVSIEKNIIILSLGFSHLIHYILPMSVVAKCPSQTEIVLFGANKQEIGQVTAELRAYHPPSSYKGKGIRYVDEVVRTKEAKKK